ncbi:hypothetical protein RJ639_028135 [Escallonia herrerae]|uniref:Retrotransposon gag domain-containing protein n=1 Tax=Escallonia herrerae TaxID=1293975 RepID=A0AA88X318_9ASTE|nr:hypothetical protein RJ639_028135 [Escallonia herrerae]
MLLTSLKLTNNAGTEGDLIVKQFIRSLKGNTFNWYTDIKPESIDCWEAMEHEFLNRFYNTRRSVSMMELTNTRQWKDEPVVDYINRWRSLSLDCKERLSEISGVEMCMQGMHRGLLYILQGNRLTSFEELATRAHDMEISIANHGGNSPALPDPRKERKEGKKVERSSKMTGKESLAVTTASLKVPKKDKYKEEKAPEHLQEKPSVELEHVPREENRMADALTNLATTLAQRGEDKVDIPVCQQWVLPELLDCQIEEIDAISVRVVEAED